MTVPVDSADAAWLRMDHPENRMVIVAVLTLDGRQTLEGLRGVVDRRLLRFDRFRRRVVKRGGRLLWEDDPEFDLARHVIAVSDSGDMDDAGLQRYVGDVMSAPLPEGRPPWQFQLIERFGEGSAVIARLHHGIADGIALMGVLLGMADGQDGPAPDVNGAETTTAVESGGPVDVAVGIAQGVVDTLEAVAEESVGWVLEPERAVGRIKQGFGIAAALGKFALVDTDSPSPFRGPLTTTKRVAWSSPVPLADVKAASKALGVTVNDVLLTVLAGALGRFMAGRGAVDPSTELRTVVPVNLRPPGEPLTLGNRFGMVLLALPVGVTDPLERCREVHLRMTRIKQSMEPPVSLGILQTLGNVPKPVQDAVIGRLSRSSSAVMTNVPGPGKRLTIDGHPLRQVMFWVPRAGTIGLGISILSYAGEVMLGFAVDAGLVSDPTLLVKAYEQEWLSLREAAIKTPRQADA